jgi:large subunit ribosomal protein L20
MARVKRGVTTRAKHKRLLEQAKGYYGRRKNTIRIARQAVEKAGQYAYRDRKVLADIAMHEGEAFSAIIAQAKAALPKAA